MQKYYLYIDECGDHNLANFDEQFPKQIGIKIIPHEQKKDCQN